MVRSVCACAWGGRRRMLGILHHFLLYSHKTGSSIKTRTCCFSAGPSSSLSAFHPSAGVDRHTHHHTWPLIGAGDVTLVLLLRMLLPSHHTSPSALFSELGPLSEPELDWPASQPQEFSDLCPPGLGLQAADAVPRFLRDCWRCRLNAPTRVSLAKSSLKTWFFFLCSPAK